MKSYQAVYNLGNGSIFQLANEELPNIQLGNEGDAALALLSTSRPYSLSSMWEARTRSDYYTVSLDNGERKQIAKRIMAVSASPHKVNMRIGMARRIVAGTRSPWRKVSNIA